MITKTWLISALLLFSISTAFAKRTVVLEYLTQST
jgi:hypothetical protein